MIIKSPSLADKYSHIYSQDSALSLTSESDDETEAAKYNSDASEAYTRFIDSGDMSHLAPYIKEGQECAIWELKPVQGRARRLLVALAQAHSDPDGNLTNGEVFFVACALCLRSVKGVFGADGKPLKLEKHRDRDTKLMCLTDETMNLLDGVDKGSLVTELGIRVFSQMSLDPD